jgi:hypothetical protein
MKKKVSSLVVLLLVAGVFQTIAAASASAATLNVGYTLEGCTLQKGTYDQATATCDNAGYTTGELKGWNELDLVPFRVTLDNNGSSSQTGDFVVAGDYKNGAGTATGWDAISILTLNTANSDANCPAVLSGATTITPSGQGAGGADQTIYRLITATIPADTTCVYDYYMRLALGAHLFSGASLQGNLWNPSLTSSGVGQKRVSLPVGPILPPQMRKEMTAQQGADVAWTISKNATPATRNFGNICDPAHPTSLTTNVTITWTKGAPIQGGDVTINTQVFIKNNAQRVLQADVTDVIKSGSTTLDTATALNVQLPANTETKVIDKSITVTAAQASGALTDHAEATIEDVLTGVPIPGTITADGSATIQSSGNVTNNSAVITDTESLTGSGLEFSVAAPSIGSFTNGYTAGSHTTGPVEWSSGTVNGSGSVTFNKTIYYVGPGDASGTLADTATLTGSQGFTAQASASVGITSSSIATLTINKTTDVKVAADTVFEFTVTGPNNFSTKVNVTVPAGSDSGSNTLAGLDDGDYLVTESDSADWNEDTPKAFTISAGECADSVTFNNTIRKAKILVDKVTQPGGSGQSFEFDPSYGANFFLKDADPVNDSGPLAPGSGYSVAEVNTPTGWDQKSATCDDGSPVNNITLSPGETVTCTFTNIQRGHIIVDKVTSPSGSTQSFEFDPSYGANFNLKDTDTPNDSGALVPGNYSVAEVTPLPDGWDLTNTTCVSSLGGTESSASIDLTAGETVTCTFTNTQRGHIIIDKVTDPSGSTQSFAFHPSYGANFNLTDTATPNDSGPLVPNTYSVAEVTPLPAGWDLTSASCSDGSPVTAISLQAGETVTCTFYDRQRATISVSKTLTNGPSDTVFTFELRNLSDDNNPLDPADDTVGDLIDSKPVTANNTPVQLNGYLVPGTYTICEVLPGPGWTSDLGGASQYTLTIGLDNSRVCADFTVGAGEAKVVAVANTRPGGAQLTIGFWKNHAGCKTSKGKQTDVLGQTLALADLTGGTTIGTLTLHASNCVEARNILDKTTIDGKTRKSSDPLFNMAAQLLAAKLNVTGGAGTCAAATNAINAAQALLVKYSWNGLTYTGPLTPDDAALANQLNTTLDLYNNGNLC